MPVRREPIVAHAVRYAILERPRACFGIVAVGRNICEVGLAVCLGIQRPRKEGYALGSRAGRIGSKQAITDTAGDTVFDRPRDRLGVVRIRRNIREAAQQLRLGRARRTPQERYDLRSGAGLARCEQVIADAAVMPFSAAHLTASYAKCAAETSAKSVCAVCFG